MTPGERCDEIVRIIDETLGASVPPLPVPSRPHGGGEQGETVPTTLRTA